MWSVAPLLVCGAVLELRSSDSHRENSIAFSSSGSVARLSASCDADAVSVLGIARLDDTQNGEEVVVRKTDLPSDISVAFSPMPSCTAVRSLETPVRYLFALQSHFCCPCMLYQESQLCI